MHPQSDPAITAPFVLALSSTPLHTQSAVEETLARIATMGGVEGYLITDGAGQILRKSKNFSATDAASYAKEVLTLTMRARHVVRDLDPKVRTRRDPRSSVCARLNVSPFAPLPPHAPPPLLYFVTG